jgi:ATP-dependent Lon protease
MPSGLLPLFPLQLVVFPRTRVPLHIFEERYKEMVGEAIRNKTEFGIVLAKDNGIANVGCTVVVDKVVKDYPDGRMDILTRGQRRFEILFLNEEKSYLQAEVQYFDDEDTMPTPDPMLKSALASFSELLKTGQTAFFEPDLKDPQLSFQLAQGIQDVDFLHLLLRTRSELDRIKELTDYLAHYVPQQRHVARVKAVAPLNGFGGPHPEA